MKLTKTGEYGLRALLRLALAYEQKTLSLREISKKERIPYKFLEQIMILLRKNRFVRSLKGQKGGYVLARSPKEITLGEIIRAIEGPLAPIETAREIEKRIQTEDEHPGLYCVLLEVRNAIAEVLDQKTLADVCDKSIELASTKSPYQMYYI